jgi:hypothetical protein
MRRLFCTVLVAVALAMYGTPAGAQEASVEQLDLSAITIPFDDGGACTGVPDTIPGIFDFTSACASHDLCYAGGEQSQAECDSQFREDMTALCVAQHPAAFAPLRYVCLTFAQLYYVGVRLFGQYFI